MNAAEQVAELEAIKTALLSTTDPKSQATLQAEFARLSGTATGDLPLPGQKTTVRTTTKTPGVPQNVMHSKLEEFVASNAKLRDLLVASRGDVVETSAAVARTTLAHGDAEVAAINARGDIDTAKLDAQAATNAFFNATMGPNDAFVAAQTARTKAQQVKDSLRPRIDAESAITIFDDPLRWAINQFTLPTLKQAYNAANATDAEMLRRIQANQQLSSQQQAIDSGPIQEQVKRRVAAEAQTMALKATTVALQAKQEGAKYTAQSVMQEAQLAGVELAAWQAEARIFSESVAETKAGAADSALQPVADILTMQNASIGAPPVTVGYLKGLSGAERNELVRRSRLPPGLLATDPGEAYRTFVNDGTLQLVAEHNKPVATLLATTQASTAFKTALEIKQQRDPKFATLPIDEQYAQIYTQLAKEQTRELLTKGSYDKLDKADPNKLKIGTAVQYKELATNVWTKEVAALLATKTFQGEVMPEELENTLIGKVMADPTKASMYAKELSDFYRQAQLRQWVDSGASALGYPKPTAFKTSTMTIGGKQVDQWSPAELVHWLTVKTAERIRRQGRNPDGTPVQGTPEHLSVQQAPFDPRFVAKP